MASGRRPLRSRVTGCRRALLFGFLGFAHPNRGSSPRALDLRLRLHLRLSTTSFNSGLALRCHCCPPIQNMAAKPKGSATLSASNSGRIIAATLTSPRKTWRTWAELRAPPMFLIAAHCASLLRRSHVIACLSGVGVTARGRGTIPRFATHKVDLFLRGRAGHPAEAFQAVRLKPQLEGDSTPADELAGASKFPRAGLYTL